MKLSILILGVTVLTIVALIASVWWSLLNFGLGNDPSPQSLTASTRDFVARTYPDARVSNCREVGERIAGAGLIACQTDRLTDRLRRDLERESGKGPLSATPTSCFTVLLSSKDVVVHGVGFPDIKGLSPAVPCDPIHD